MIYIMKKSKKLQKSITIKKSLTDAKFYLYNLTKPNFFYSDYYVVGTDFTWELEDLLNFFSKRYISKVDRPHFDVYYVNPNCIKPDRQARQHIQSMNFFKRLKQKLQRVFSEYIVTIAIKNNRTAIQLENNLLKMNFILDNQLNILDALIDSSLTDEVAYLSLLEDVRKKLDKHLVKQRYYYKKKEKDYGEE